MKKLILIIFFFFLVYAIGTGGLNSVLYKNTNNLNDLIDLQNEFHEEKKEKIQKAFNFNPYKVLQKNKELKSEISKVRDVLLDEYNDSIVSIARIQGQIQEIEAQAIKYGVTVSPPITEGQVKLEMLEKFDFEKIKDSIPLQKALDARKNDLKSIFLAYNQELLKQGKFANPLWGMTDAELLEWSETMTPEEKAGQLIMFSISGLSLSQTQKKDYTEDLPGSFILMGANISNTDQVKNLTKEIQLLNPKIPLFIGTDQEGGVVKRVFWDTTSGEKKWAEMGDNDLCTEATARSNMLLEMGINVNFAPVVDLTNPNGGFINNRTISSNPQVVSDKTKVYVNCAQTTGLISSLKHYPGHGATEMDSHYTLPEINKSKASWLKEDALPYINNLDSKMLMVGHLVYKSIDPVSPASQSKIWINDTLKNELGYKGIIITDDMSQLHTSTKISVPNALSNAFNSGVDIVMYVNFPIERKNISAELVELIKSEVISPSEVNDSVYKILLAKRDLK